LYCTSQIGGERKKEGREEGRVSSHLEEKNCLNARDNAPKEGGKEEARCLASASWRGEREESNFGPQVDSRRKGNQGRTFLYSQEEEGRIDRLIDAVPERRGREKGKASGLFFSTYVKEDLTSFWRRGGGNRPRGRGRERERTIFISSREERCRTDAGRKGRKALAMGRERKQRDLNFFVSGNVKRFPAAGGKRGGGGSSSMRDFWGGGGGGEKGGFRKVPGVAQREKGSGRIFSERRTLFLWQGLGSPQ